MHALDHRAWEAEVVIPDQTLQVWWLLMQSGIGSSPPTRSDPRIIALLWHSESTLKKSHSMHGEDLGLCENSFLSQFHKVKTGVIQITTMSSDLQNLWWFLVLT